VPGLDAHWEDVTSQIVLDEAWAPALDGLDEFSHIIVLTWLHEQPPRTPDEPHTHPQGRLDLPAVGLFATRTPRRPNPIGMTVVPLLARTGHVLTVQGLDMADGTPVLDLKPYLARGDRINQPRMADWTRQLWAEADQDHA
ncbi:MAG: tRNA (N6-threonylcarbamoyladenosine(37)-N6)-methyltransferase TrmO, partial [Chloroflexi bacterium]|nr:tRNA (N6-threonylcarbamoyladenosine(37)-N6)-methyltransferase TrmO [Chloroflexota bacterium]